MTNDITCASGSAPADHPLYAPGIKWRPRDNGPDAPYWIPPTKDVKAGYAPKSISLDRDKSQEEIAARCRALWQGLLSWRNEQGKPKEVRFTFSWLIDRYLNDSTSPFQKVSTATQDGYRFDCKVIREKLGELRLDPKKEGGMWTPRIIGADIARWHEKFGKPVQAKDADGRPRTDGDGKPIMVASVPSRARHLISQVRGLITYAVTLGVPGARDIREILTVMKFDVPDARTNSVSYEQVDALVKQAEKDGYISIAIATLAQYELIERRVHIIGKWEHKDEWIGGWVWERVTPDWWITYYQNKTKRTERTYDLKNVQRLLGLMQLTPKEKRVGPIIRCEATNEPWRRRYYAEVFRDIARRAGLPDDLWSMDMRAGGATEADGVEGVSDRALQDAGGWADPRMRDRYRREKQRNARNVVALRQKARGE